MRAIPFGGMQPIEPQIVYLAAHRAKGIGSARLSVVANLREEIAMPAWLTASTDSGSLYSSKKSSLRSELQVFIGKPMAKWLVPAFCAIMLPNIQVIRAQDASNVQELQKQAQNPVASLISLPFQNNINFPIGTSARVGDVLNIQPVIPVKLDEDWNLIIRWIAPVVYQPNPTAGEGGANGLGDMSPTFFISPAHPGKVIWGAGPALQLPTATQRTLGQGKWAAGPSIVVLTQPRPWSIGFVANNVWSFAGDRNRKPLNQFYTQYFLNYNLKKGWYVGPSPIVTCNWNAPGGDRWTVPFGWSVGKIARVGTQPFNVQLGTYYNVVHPRDTPYGKWQMRLQVAMLFPKAK